MAEHYTGVAKALHWAIALIMITMLIFGQGFDGSEGADLAFSLTGHSSLGMIVISLILMRVFWRIGHPPPSLPDTVPPLQRTAARLSHLALYGLMIYLPATGIITAAAHEIPIMTFGAFDLRGVLAFLGADDFEGRRYLHEIGTKALIGLLLVHIGAAVLHHFVQKDNILRRMLPGKR